MSTTLLEFCLCEAQAEQIDEESGTIRNVKILGRESKRGRIYSEKALLEARDFYEGMRVNFDHPNESQPAVVRGFFDQIGRLTNCRVQADGVWGDLEYLKTHPGAPLLLESARRFPNLLGLSHNADGDKRREPGGKVIVESITAVRGVDIVTRPATNGGLFESEGDDEPMAKTKKIKLRTLIESAPAGPYRDRAKLLIEEDPMLAEMPVEVPAEEAPAEAEASAEDKIRESLQEAAVDVVKRIFSGEMTPEDGVAKIKELLGMADQAAPEGDASAGEGGDGGGDSGAEAAAMEAVNARLSKVEARNALLECESMLLRSNREAKPAWIQALAAIPVGSRKTLLESFPQKAAAANPRRPDRSPGILESDGAEDDLPKDAKEFVAQMRR